MPRFIIEGKTPLQGSIGVRGAKNGVLPILAATLLTDGISVIKNCPKISDVTMAKRVLENLGCRVKVEENVVSVDTTTHSGFEIPETLMREMRSTVVFLGAIIARTKKARISTPGGCELGARPIDMHLSAMKRMGVSIKEAYGYIECTCEGDLVGQDITLSFPSVGATENIILAASLAKGTTLIINAAKEPEIEDLQNFLNAMGAKISGAGGSIIRIDGVEKLHPTEYAILPDRVVAATYCIGAAITGGEVCVKKINPCHLSSFFSLMEDAGVQIDVKKEECIVRPCSKIAAVPTVRTMPYPGFPTDMQAPLMAMLSLGRGSSVFIENIFESRYKHAPELARMGANIKTEGRVAIVDGVKELTGASVNATDLRGGAALI